jgi:hypothetical protein
MDFNDLKEKLENYTIFTNADTEVEIELGDYNFPISDVYFDKVNNKIVIQYEF